MVDINLLGEEEERREELPPEENFAQTVNLGMGETVDEDEKISPFLRESMPGVSFSRETMGGSGSFTRMPPMSSPPSSRGSRNKAYLLVAGLILAALVAVYFMIPRVGKKPVNTVDQFEKELPPSEAPDTIAEAPAPGSETPASQPMVSRPEPAPAGETLSSLSPRERSLLASTRLGAYTVGALAQSFNGGNDFSLITFYGSNNSFLVEFMAPSNAAITEITQALQRNASPQELRTVSQVPATGNGRSMSTVLVTGKVSESAGLMAPRGGQQRMGFEELSAWLKNLGNQHALRLKLFETGKAYRDGELLRTPVRVNFSGDKNNVFNFLRSLADAGANIALSKIIVSPSDRKALSSETLDLVLNFDFVEM